LDLRVSSEVYDDAISAMRGANLSLSIAHSFVSDMKSIPHVALPMSGEIAEDAMAMHAKYGGRRNLSYFDSFHVATARRYSLEFITSDGYLIDHAKTLGIRVESLSSIVK
jgi:predicted nucleic acid-binding protein